MSPVTTPPGSANLSLERRFRQARTQVVCALYDVLSAMRVLTYNFLKGGGPPRNAWSLLADLKPDLILGQECRPTPGHPYAGALWTEVNACRWGTGLFQRRKAVRRIAVPGFEGWVAGGELRRAAWLTNRPLLVFSIHCPALKRSYVEAMHAILDAVAPLASGSDLLLGGDFNVAAGIRPSGDQVPFSRGERLLMERLEHELGLMPCWQTMHPDEPLAQTLRWTGNRSTPYHCDGIFAPRAWRPRLMRCEVITGPEWDVLSDHNPVVADFI